MADLLLSSPPDPNEITTGASSLSSSSFVEVMPEALWPTLCEAVGDLSKVLLWSYYSR